MDAASLSTDGTLTSTSGSLVSDNPLTYIILPPPGIANEHSAAADHVSQPDVSELLGFAIDYTFAATGTIAEGYGGIVGTANAQIIKNGLIGLGVDVSGFIASNSESPFFATLALGAGLMASALGSVWWRLPRKGLPPQLRNTLGRMRRQRSHRQCR